MMGKYVAFHRGMERYNDGDVKEARGLTVVKQHAEAERRCLCSLLSDPVLVGGRHEAFNGRDLGQTQR